MRTAWIPLALLGLGCAGRGIEQPAPLRTSPAMVFRMMTEKIAEADSVLARAIIRRDRSGVPGQPDQAEDVEVALHMEGGRALLYPSGEGTSVREIGSKETRLLLDRMARYAFLTEPRPGATRERIDDLPILMEFKRLGKETIRGEEAEKIGYVAIRRRGSVPEVECLCTVWISTERGLPIKRERRYAWKKIHVGTYTVTEIFDMLRLDPPRAEGALTIAR